MPLPASCYVPPPSPWVWPGRGSSVDTTMVRGPPPATLPAGPPGPCGPLGLLAGPSTVGPPPVPPPTTPAADPKKTSPTPHPPALSRIFSGCHAPFYPYCAIVQREHCRSYADAARPWDLLPGTYPGDDQRVEGGIHGGHESLLEPVRR